MSDPLLDPGPLERLRVKFEVMGIRALKWTVAWAQEKATDRRFLSGMRWPAKIKRRVDDPPEIPKTGA